MTRILRLTTLALAFAVIAPTPDNGWCGSDSDCELVFGPELN